MNIQIFYFLRQCIYANSIIEMFNREISASSGDCLTSRDSIYNLTTEEVENIKEKICKRRNIEDFKNNLCYYFKEPNKDRIKTELKTLFSGLNNLFYLILDDKKMNNEDIKSLEKLEEEIFNYLEFKLKKVINELFNNSNDSKEIRFFTELLKHCYNETYDFIKSKILECLFNNVKTEVYYNTKISLCKVFIMSLINTSKYFYCIESDNIESLKYYIIIHVRRLSNNNFDYINLIHVIMQIFYSDKNEEEQNKLDIKIPLSEFNLLIKKFKEKIKDARCKKKMFGISIPG
ncbi:hypothetical protein A0H76_907 [Hepatospora eriocheir]|uniref:Uncharacterized protein n=1 Tax=Hepatospora eriocheir TaxID=1081669 RepID=A0A1X0QHZ2_9MICR|nr:hypothetical protein A0H76_907 [Hepatospora eriocheir]